MSGEGQEQTGQMIYAAAVIIGFLFFGWVFFLKKKNVFGGREWRPIRDNLLIIMMHYSILYIIIVFLWMPLIPTHPVYEYLLRIPTLGVITHIIINAGAVLPQVHITNNIYSYIINPVIYILIIISACFGLHLIIKPKTGYSARPCSVRRIIRSMRNGSLIIPTVFTEKKEKHGLIFSSDDLHGGFYISGSPRSGKTELALSLYFYMFLVYCVGRDFTAVIFDVKGDWINNFYEEDMHDIILGYKDATYTWNMFQEVNTADDIKNFFDSLLPYHPHSDRVWVDGARLLGSSIAIALMRYAAAENKEVNNADFINAFRMQRKDLIDFLKTYNDKKTYDLNPSISLLEGEAKGMGSSIQNSMLIDLEKLFVGDSFSGQNSTLPEISIKKYMQDPESRRLFLKYDEIHGLRMQNIFKLLYDLAIQHSFTDKNKFKIFANDEFSLTPFIERYSRCLNVGRDYKLFMITCVQTKSQVDNLYGKNEAGALIGGHKFKLFFRCGDPADREYAKECIGTEQEISEDPDRLVGKKVTVIHPYSDNVLDELPPGMCIMKSPYGYNKIAFPLYAVNKKLFTKAYQKTRQRTGLQGFINRAYEERDRIFKKKKKAGGK